MLLVLLTSGASHAAVFTVTRYDDPAPDGCAVGDCSLREAILTANKLASADKVKLNTGTYTLTRAIPPNIPIIPNDVGGLTIRDRLTIEGNDEDTTIIDGNGLDTVIHVSPDNPGPVEISGVTVRNGKVVTNPAGKKISNGGGIYSSANATLTLKNVTVTSNTGVWGGGIYNSGGALTLNDTTVTGNNAPPYGANREGGVGGGILSFGTLALNNSTVSGNSAGAGGGIYGEGSATLQSSTISLNKFTGDASTGWGGGIRFRGPLTLTDSSVAGNHSTWVGNCGAIKHSEGTLTIQTSTIHGNSAEYSGGICTDSAKIVNSVISGNSSFISGAAVHMNTWPSTTGDFTLDMSAVKGNLGIAILHRGGTLTLKNSEISANKKRWSAEAGLVCDDGTATLTNVTISGNEYDGIAIVGSASRSPTLDANNVTVSHNDGYGITHSLWAGTTLENTIAANNTSGDCIAWTSAPAITSAGHNLIENLTSPTPKPGTTSCGISGVTTGNIIGSDPVLGSLGNNGGPTATQALLSGSPAIDAANNTSCHSTDQRGAARPIDGDSDGTATCDMGAYEGGATAPAPPPSPPPAPTQTSLTSPAGNGSKELQVLSTQGFSVGDEIVLNPFGDNEELNVIAGLGSMILTSALKFDHEPGEPIAQVTQAAVPPVADADGPYVAECQGPATAVQLDGAGSSDPDSSDVLSFAWTTTCPDGSFDDASSPTPILTVGTSDTCSILCGVGLTVTNDDGLMDSDAADVTIQDTTAPEIDCNAPATIVPPDAPVSFTAVATDNCASSLSVDVTGYDCFKYTKKSKRVDKTASCMVAFGGESIAILDSGGVGNHINWTVRASDDCGNVREKQCQVEVVNPGRRR
jgi:CSLREA domain-containing protein